MSQTPAQAITEALNNAAAQLTGSGAPFEIEERLINGVPLKCYKSAPLTVRDALAQGRTHGDKVFISYQGEQIDFSAFFDSVDRLGRHMADHYHVQKGDRVAIAMRNYPEWMMAFVAIVSIGAVVVPLNSWGQAEELAYALSDAGAKLVFCDQQRCNAIAPQLPELDCHAVVVRPEQDSSIEQVSAWPSTQEGPATLPEVDISSGDLAMIMYTSGTTGRPKGAASTQFAVCQALYNFEVHSYMSAMVNSPTIEKMMSSAYEPATLLAVPLFHVSGCYSVFMLNLRGGRKTAIMYKWDPEEALRIIEQERISIVTGVPTMTMALFDSPNFASTDTSSLFSIGAGGAACPPHLSELIYSRLAHAYPGTGYGMTETNATCANCTGEAFRIHPSSAGTLSPIVECKTVDDRGEDLPRGEPGELYVRSPTNVQQYWNLPDASAETFIDGWVATGDVGYLDEDGFLFIVDRIKDMVIRGGENIYPIEVEGILLTVPDVREAAVFGVPHEQWGEELVAIVYGPSSLDTEQLKAHVGKHAAAYKVPASIQLSSEPLAKNAAGKLLKKTIRANYLELRQNS